MFFFPYDSFNIFFLKSFSSIFFSFSIRIPSILNPLLTIALLTSLFDDKILQFVIKSKIFIPFLISFNLILISGKFLLKPPPSKVSFAVCSAFFEAFHHAIS